MGSLIMREADANKVPAGGALAVDRDHFSEGVTNAINTHPNIEIVRQKKSPACPPQEWGNVIIATGPLTSPALGKAIHESDRALKRWHFSMRLHRLCIKSRLILI